MKIAICDNENRHISLVSDMLSKYRKEKMISMSWTSFSSGFALLAALDCGEVFDAVFLDIYMDDMNGMEVAKRIRSMNNQMHIIFLTSSAQFAVDSYTVEATDYLLKPITTEKFFHSLDRLVSRFANTEDHGFTVKDTDGRITKITLHQLIYLEAMGHYVMLHHADGSSTKTLMAFSALAEPLLASGSFAQSHRSYIVNLHYVHRLGQHELFMLNGTQIPLPKSRHQQLSTQFHRFIFGGDGL